MYASVRGWLEIGFEHRVAAERIIERNRHDLYSGGWAFPSAPFNWALYLFYGGDIREGELGWLREQITELAAMPAVDEDGDRPVGLFLVTDERGNADIWQIRDGTVHQRPAPDFKWLGE
jgi:hypothetical protein